MTHIPWVQDNLSDAVVMEQNVGSSHLVPAVTRPAWPHLYLKVHQELLTLSV